MVGFEKGNPIITRRRTGKPESPYVSISEYHQIDNSTVNLSEIPDKKARVAVTGNNEQWYEKSINDNEPLKENEYIVNYTDGLVTFHSSKNGLQLQFKFTGTGLRYIPAAMVYTKSEKGNVSETLADIVIEGSNVIKDITNAKIEIDQVLPEANALVNNTKYNDSYNPQTSYKKNNIVSFNGSSYISLVNNNMGNTPPDPSVVISNDFWGLLSRKGNDGNGTVGTYRDVFIASEGQRVFNLTHTYDQFQNRIKVTIGNVPQFNNYVESTSKSITLNEGVGAGTVVVIEYFGETLPLESDIQTTVDNHSSEISRLNTDKLPEPVYEVFTATENQSVFTLKSQYTLGKNRLKIYVEGIRQFAPNNFTETTVNSFTLSEGVPLNTEVIAEVYI